MSCIQISSVKPNEEGTAVIELSFTDEDNNTVVPTNLEWQLMDKDRNIINNRSFSNGSFTGTTVVLSGDDLVISGLSDNGERYFCVQGLYSSSAGSNLPIKGELKFDICKLLNIEDG